jgi:hypothetical protein
MVGAGDALLMACTWRAPAHPAGDRIPVHARQWLRSRRRDGGYVPAGFLLFCDLSACGADEFGVF